MGGPADAFSLARGRSWKVLAGVPGGVAVGVPIRVLWMYGNFDGRGTDEDFEPVEAEVGTFLGFLCHGDSGVRSFFRQRAIIDSKTYAPREHEWAFEYVGGDEQRTVVIRGRLYDYQSRQLNENKVVEMSGRIRIADQ